MTLRSDIDELIEAMDRQTLEIGAVRGDKSGDEMIAEVLNARHRAILSALQMMADVVDRLTAELGDHS